MTTIATYRAMQRDFEFPIGYKWDTIKMDKVVCEATGKYYFAKEMNNWNSNGCKGKHPQPVHRDARERPIPSTPCPQVQSQGSAPAQQQPVFSAPEAHLYPQPYGYGYAAAGGGATFPPAAQPTTSAPMPDSHQQQYFPAGGNGAIFTPGPYLPTARMVYTNQPQSNYNAGSAPAQNWAYGSPFTHAGGAFALGPTLPVNQNWQQINVNAGLAPAQTPVPMVQFGVNASQFTTPQQMGSAIVGAQYAQPQEMGSAVGGDQFTAPFQVQTAMLPTFPQPQPQQPAPVAGPTAEPDWLPLEPPKWVDDYISGLQEETGVSGPNPTNLLPAGSSEATSEPDKIQRNRPGAHQPALSRAQRRSMGLDVPTHKETREAVARVAAPVAVPAPASCAAPTVSAPIMATTEPEREPAPVPVAAPVVPGPGPEESYLTPESPFPKHRSPSREYDSLFGSSPPPAPTPEPEEVQPTESEPEQEEDPFTDLKLTDKEFDDLIENWDFDDEST